MYVALTDQARNVLIEQCGKQSRHANITHANIRIVLSYYDFIAVHCSHLKVSGYECKDILWNISFFKILIIVFKLIPNEISSK